MVETNEAVHGKEIFMEDKECKFCLFENIFCFDYHIYLKFADIFSYSHLYPLFFLLIGEVFRIIPEFSILRLTFCRNNTESQPQNAELGRL